MASTITISKKLLNKFMNQEKLSGIASFLHSLSKRSGLQRFYSFSDSNKYKLHFSEQLPKGVLFHGSQKLQTTIVPNASIGRGGKAEKQTLVHATDGPNYAIFLALLDLKNGGAGVTASNKNTILTVDIGFVNGLSKLRNGYVHILPNQKFRKTKKREYITNMTVETMFAVPVTPQDLTVPVYIQTEGSGS